jgi:hypothetical protein
VLKLLGEGGLGKMQLLGGAGEAVQRGHGNEGLEMAEVQIEPFIPKRYHSYIKHSIVKMSGNE